ncbi:CinA family protein [Pleionea litopenaei]|uniref:CinA family protein n=1 Tax=Pleionea litopenaei TaxID=3070815 RepID=A0AA51RUZ7_9GAMM|nr:CinA family protein [Pleionea sp. HL-JVS1]WMS87974.1 CinA family protein [Pleionea sp. HL-JVS1]
MDELLKLNQRLASLYQSKNWMIATAESCTGGWIAKSLTDLAGSSAIFDSGFVTYSNQAKMRMLDVEERILIEHGAVSKPVVEAMANGALNRSAADVAISVSGIAGPTGGSKEKPVGLVWIGWAAAEQITSSQAFHFSGTRENIRISTVREALKILIQLAEN